MLNELLVAERGLARAGVEMTLRHGDIKDVRKGLPTLLVRLDADGRVADVRAVPKEARPWTLGDVKHNRFPFVQPKIPFWWMPPDDPLRKVITGRDINARRTAILSLMDRMPLNVSAAQLIGATFVRRLRERSADLSADESNFLAYRVAEAMRRFEKAAGPSANHARFTRELSVAIIESMRDSTDENLTAIAAGLLIGKCLGTTAKAEAGLLFDTTPTDSLRDHDYPIWHSNVAEAVSAAMQQTEASSSESERPFTVCALTGSESPLLSGSFPEPNLPTLGLTLLFSRNTDIPSLARYREYDRTMPVARSTVERLQAAVVALTQPQREGKTWCAIPGERPKQTDLLLSYVVTAPDAPVAEIVTSERDLEQLAKELVETIKANVGDLGLGQTPVRLVILRRVDPGNRKAIVNNTFNVARLEAAANDWAGARHLLPPGLTLPVPDRKKVVEWRPPNVAPLRLVDFTRSHFIRGGLESADVIGITAAEALALFLDEGRVAAQRAKRILRLVLQRRTVLVTGCAHARRREFDYLLKFDRKEVLRTVTVLCVILHKLGLHKESDMSDSPAYKLGQLLAAADIIHAGYCADVRGGKMPPSLLGNQVLTAAQKSPIKALEMLCRRWKPYGAWANQVNVARDSADDLVSSKVKKDQQRGWNVRHALRHARDLRSLAAELAEQLPAVKADDIYRAELLLGYLAGLPKREYDEQNNDNTNNERKVI